MDVPQFTYLCAHFSVDINFQSIWVNTKEYNYSRIMFSFVKDHKSFFQNGCTILHSQQQ